MAAYRVENVLKNGASVAVGASETNTAVSDVFGVGAEDSRNLLVRLVAGSVTVTNAVTGKLQSSWDGGTTWKDHGTVSITGNGTFEIEHDASEASTGCLWPLARVVVTSGVSDAATISAVYATRRL